MDSQSALIWTQKLIAIAVIFQTLELALIRDTYSDKGVWRWDTLRGEFKIFSTFNQAALNFFLKYRNFCALLLIRFLLGVFLIFAVNPVALTFLLISTILISLRWRGTFNGGSDYVTVLVLYSITFASFNNASESIGNAVLWYIALQIVASYFISGVVKIKKKNWRNGAALEGFISSTIYQESKLTNYILENKVLLLLMSWAIMIFEICFVVSFLNPQICIAFLTVAILFHLANFYIFGLNRFIFSWISCYPAIYYCSGLVG